MNVQIFNKPFIESFWLQTAAMIASEPKYDFRTLVSLGPNACDPLERRLAALDLDPVEVSEIAPQTFRDLQRVCSFCQSHRRCLRNLARDPGKPEWTDYCPNVEILMALDAMPWTSRRGW